jgi:hypothetical protein
MTACGFIGKEGQGMTTNFQKLLQKHAKKALYDGPDAAGGFDYFLSLAAEAVVADGLDRDTVAFLLISNALRVLNEEVVARANVDRVLQIAQMLHDDYEDPEDIKRQVLEWKKGQR